MRNQNAKSRILLLAATFVGMMNVSGLCAGANSWKNETVLVSPQGDQTVVRSVEGDKILFKNADPQLAIEWGLANARTTVVLAGKYVIAWGVQHCCRPLAVSAPGGSFTISDSRPSRGRLL